jgi:hypothetical protein
MNPTRLVIEATWSFPEAVHIGTGLSREGAADRLIRVERRRKKRLSADDDQPDDLEKWDPRDLIEVPLIPGDAVKGAIRGSAERVVRWLVPDLREEAADHSLPEHPAVGRIFASQAQPFYRFSAARYIDRSGGRKARISGTAINSETGIAKEETLRVMESWGGGASFQFLIEGFGGHWKDADSTDHLDLALLLAAFLSTTSVGGRKGAGYGFVHAGCEIPEIDPITTEMLRTPALLARLQQSLLNEAKLNA